MPRRGGAAVLADRPRFNEAAGAYPADATCHPETACPAAGRFNEAAGAYPADAWALPTVPALTLSSFNEAAGAYPADAAEAAETAGAYGTLLQ